MYNGPFDIIFFRNIYKINNINNDYYIVMKFTAIGRTALVAANLVEGMLFHTILIPSSASN